MTPERKQHYVDNMIHHIKTTVKCLKSEGASLDEIKEILFGVVSQTGGVMHIHHDNVVGTEISIMSKPEGQ